MTNRAIVESFLVHQVIDVVVIETRPPEETTTDGEARYIERKERAAKRLAQNDLDY